MSTNIPPPTGGSKPVAGEALQGPGSRQPSRAGGATAAASAIKPAASIDRMQRGGASRAAADAGVTVAQGASGLSLIAERQIATSLDAADNRTKLPLGVQLPPPSTSIDKGIILRALGPMAKGATPAEDLLATVRATPAAADDLSVTNWTLALAFLLRSRQQALLSQTEFKDEQMIYAGVGRILTMTTQQIYDVEEVIGDRLEIAFNAAKISSEPLDREGEAARANLTQRESRNDSLHMGEIENLPTIDAEPATLAHMRLGEALNHLGTTVGQPLPRVLEFADIAGHPAANNKTQDTTLADLRKIRPARPADDRTGQRWLLSSLPEANVHGFSAALRERFAARPLARTQMTPEETAYLKTNAPDSLEAFKNIKRAYDEATKNQPVRLSRLMAEYRDLDRAATQCDEAAKTLAADPGQRNTAAIRALEQHRARLQTHMDGLLAPLVREKQTVDTQVMIVLASRQETHRLMTEIAESTGACYAQMAKEQQKIEISQVASAGAPSTPQEMSPQRRQQIFALRKIKDQLGNMEVLQESITRQLNAQDDHKTKRSGLAKLWPLQDVPRHLRDVAGRFRSGRIHMHYAALATLLQAPTAGANAIPGSLHASARMQLELFQESFPLRVVANNMLSTRYAQAARDDRVSGQDMAVPALLAQLRAARPIAGLRSDIRTLMPSDLEGEGPQISARLAALMAVTNSKEMAKHVADYAKDGGATWERSLERLGQAGFKPDMIGSDAAPRPPQRAPGTPGGAQDIAAEGAFWRNMKDSWNRPPAAPKRVPGEDRTSYRLTNGALPASPGKARPEAPPKPETDAAPLANVVDDGRQNIRAEPPGGAVNKTPMDELDGLMDSCNQLLARAEVTALLSESFVDRTTAWWLNNFPQLNRMFENLTSLSTISDEGLRNATETGQNSIYATLNGTIARLEGQRSATQALVDQLRNFIGPLTG